MPRLTLLLSLPVCLGLGAVVPARPQVQPKGLAPAPILVRPQAECKGEGVSLARDCLIRGQVDAHPRRELRIDGIWREPPSHDRAARVRARVPGRGV